MSNRRTISNLVRIALSGLAAVLSGLPTHTANAAATRETSLNTCLIVYYAGATADWDSESANSKGFFQMLRYSVAEKVYPSVAAAQRAAKDLATAKFTGPVSERMTRDEFTAHMANCIKRTKIKPDADLQVAKALGYSEADWKAYWAKPENMGAEDKAAYAQKLKLAAEEQKAAKMAAAVKAAEDKKAVELASNAEAGRPKKFKKGWINKIGQLRWDKPEVRVSPRSSYRFQFAPCSALYLYSAGPNGVSDPQYQKILAANYDVESVGGKYKGGDRYSWSYGVNSGTNIVMFKEEMMSRDMEHAELMNEQAPFGTLKLVYVPYSNEYHSGKPDDRDFVEMLARCYRDTKIAPPATAFSASFTLRDLSAWDKDTLNAETRYREAREERERIRNAEQAASAAEANARMARQNEPISQPVDASSLKRQCEAEWATLEAARKLSKERGVMPTTEYFNRLQRYAQICK